MSELTDWIRDADDILARWQRDARLLVESGAPAVPDATPAREYARSPAAAHVGALATIDGLFHFHFERRHHLPLPLAWTDGDDERAAPPVWDAGVLPEAKYQSFRHDLPVASFHPHHREKWSTHELCHGLVGFAWRQDATPFFHAEAGRLAELLPVALWYFFDEAFLRRCPDHAGEGDTFRMVCPRCAAVAAAAPDDPTARTHLVGGLRFVEAELAAHARARRLGRPVPHRWATIDLATDGATYARSHAARLGSDTFAAYAERFLVSGGGWSESLDALEARVVDVLGGILARHLPARQAPTPAHGRWRWALQDLGWRALAATCEGGAAARRTGLQVADLLAEVIPATVRGDADVVARATAALDEAEARWRRARAKDLPDASAWLGVGYTLPTSPARPDPAAADALMDGLDGCVPIVRDMLGEAFAGQVAAFAAADGFTRAHVAVRWSSWVATTHPGPLADLAAWEAAVAVLPPGPPTELTGPAADDRRRLAAGVQVLSFAHDVLGLAERADAGEVDAALDTAGRATLVVHEGDEVVHTPTAIVLGRDARGETLLLDVDPATADALRALGPDGDVPSLPADELDALTEFGVLVPVAWAERG